MRLRILCAGMIAAVLIATLWPFDPFPRNGVSWIREGKGLSFDGQGLMLSKAPLKAKKNDAIESFSLELLLRPASINSSYAILGFYNSQDPKQFLVRQWTDGLLVTHGGVDAQGRSRTKKFDVDHAFQQGKLLLVTIVSGPNGTAVYLNGQMAGRFPKFRISGTDLFGQVVIGTSPVAYQPWPGEIHGLAIYSKELTPSEIFRHYEDWTEAPAGPPDLDRAVARYAFTEGAGREVHNEVASGPNLDIPRSFYVPHKVMLESAVKEFKTDRAYVIDVLVNIAGFIPLGFLLCACFGLSTTRPAAVFATILSGGFLSFVIEVLQAFVPQRNSGMTDIITNTLGAALGALIARPMIVRRVLRMMNLNPDV